VQSDLNTLIGLAKKGTDDDAAIATLNFQVASNVDPAGNGALTKVGFGVSDVVTQNTALQSYAIATNSTIATLTANTGITVGTVGGNNSLTSYVLLLSKLSSGLATDTQTAATASNSSGSPTTFTIEVADTAARLGNINIYGDQLIGGASGALVAPGDAQIVITNNTADTLRLGNLVIPNYDAGHVRFNGVLVTSNATINALNPGGTGAAFASVITAASSSRPQITITSNYNADGASFYDLNSTSGLYHLTHLEIAPDIILKQAALNRPPTLIDNETGAVNITSASGNIYINGTINAGSVNILAKNGDFVSSYVDGFDPIGGDPAGFNDPTRAAEAGAGITANGAISIAARYININSTIQSGIANWTLNLDGAPKLTTGTAADIGLTDTQISNAIADYKAALTAAATNVNAIVSTRINLVNSKGQTIVLNMGPAGLDAATLAADIKAYLAAVGANANASPLYTVFIGGVSQTINIKDYISGNITGRLEFDTADASSYLQQGGVGAGVYRVVSPSSNIGVAYDANHAQFVVDSTTVHGGYIQLYGQIINTASSGGQLNVLDGFGTINITNSGNIPVVLGSLSTGVDATGTLRGTEGVINITNVTGVAFSDLIDHSVSTSNPKVSVTHTVYTRTYDPANSTGQVQIATQYGHIDNATGAFDADSAVIAGTGGDRTATFDPSAGQRYVWTTGTYSETKTDFEVSGTEIFHSSSLTVNQVQNLTATNGPNIVGSHRLDDGTYLTTDATQVGNSSIGNTDKGIVIANSVGTVLNSTLENTPLVTSTYAYLTDSDLAHTGHESHCNWWSLCIASDVTDYYTLDQKFTTITTNSLKADNQIGINFIGSNTGAINVKSVGDVILTNNVSAVAGAVTIIAGSTTGVPASGTASITEGNLAGQVTGKTIEMDAAGSVGGLTSPGYASAPANAAIAVSLTGTPTAGFGSLTANAADGNVSITTRGDMTVKTVSAAGDVKAGKGNINLVAYGSIKGVDNTALIKGPRVSLSAINGAIGSTAFGQQLLVNTGFSALDRTFGDPSTTSGIILNPYYGLSASAAGDIGIRSTGWSGNIDGSILVDQVLSLGGNVVLSSTGRILDNEPLQTIDSRTYDQLLSYWDDLGLLADGSVDPSDPTAAVRTANGDKQAAQIAAYENSKTQEYLQYWHIRDTQSDGGLHYDPNFVVTIDSNSAQYIALSQQMSPAEITAFAKAQTAEYHALNAEYGNLTTKIDENYKYKASDPEKAALTDGAVWTERELAFSLSPGALKTITDTNPVVKAPNVSGRTVTIDAALGVGETVGAGTSDIGVSIAANLAPKDLSDAQKIALATAERSDIVLHINTVTLPSGTLTNIDIPLGTPFDQLSPIQQAVLTAAANGLVADSDLFINILSKRPLNFNAPAGLNVKVTAAQDPTKLDRGDAYLASRAGALLGAITVPGETRIKVLGSIGNTATGSSIATGNLVLEAAQGGIGTSVKPLDVSLNTGATFTGRAQQGVFVNFAGDALIDTVYSPQNVSLKSTGGSLLNANGDLLINVLGTVVTLNAASGAIGSAASALNVGVNLGGGIIASAAGVVDLYGPATNLFIVKSIVSGISVALTAGGEGVIDGSVSAPGDIILSGGGRYVITADGDVHSAAGQITMAAGSVKMLDGAILTADAGKVGVTTTGDALVTGITSGSSAVDAVSISAGGHILAGTGSARIDITAMAAGAGIKLVAGKGIGDVTEANAKYADGPGDVPGSANLITQVANPLRLKTAKLDILSSAGDVDIETLVAVNAATVSATTGNINILADADLHANLISAPLGKVTIDANGTLLIDVLKAKSIALDSAGELTLPDIEVADTISLGAGSLHANITQVPSGPNPLNVNLTGHHGGVGTLADVTFDTPAGLAIDKLYFTDAGLATTARNVSIADAYVPGALTLKSPLQTLIFNNRTLRPQGGNDAQFYAQGFAFNMTLQDYHTTSNAFVVKYEIGAQVTEIVNHFAYDGISLIRDTVRVFKDANTSLGQPFTWIEEADKNRPVVVVVEGKVVMINGVALPIQTQDSNPAVNLSQLQ
jgi:hypothetical protein